MKKVILILLCAFFASCASLKTGGSITSISQTDKFYLVGFSLHASGAPAGKLDSLSKGLPVSFNGQTIQILHTDTSAEVNGVISIPK